MRRLACVATLASVLVLASAPLPAGAAKGGSGGGGPGGGSRGTFSCRASAVRVEPAGLLAALPTVEPFVANAGGDPCVDADGGLPNDLIDVSVGGLISLTASLLVSRTDDGMQGVAHTGVANLSLVVLGQTISVTALTAEATAGPCPATTLQSESSVLSVSVNGLSVEVPFGQQHVEVDLSALGIGILALHLNETITSESQVIQRALWVHSDLVGDVIVAEAIADVHGNPCGKPPKPPRQPHGFMTGGGSIAGPAGRVTHGAHLECIASEGPDNLQVNWGGNRFHLESVTSTANTCSDSPTIDPGRPAATFDTIEGDGVGRCNGVPGATAHWKLTDAGEPGTADRFEVVIDGGPGCSLVAGGVLTGGNHQAHSRP